MATLTVAEISEPVHDGGTERRSHGTALAWSLAAVFFTAYTLLAVRDQQRMLTSGFDLGIFDEAVRSYAHGQLGYAPILGFDVLGDHFSPIIALWVPLYWVWPSVYALMLVQAALFALGAVPLVRWAAEEVGTVAGAVVGVGYGASWGIAAAAGFDVHEVAFAVPLLAFSAVALGQRRWRAAAAWALPLLLVKEDLGLTVGLVGVLIAVGGARRLGVATAVAGVLGSWLEINVLIPAFNPLHQYSYSSTLVRSLNPVYLVLNFITPETKVVTLLLTLAPTALLATRSRLFWLALPTFLVRFQSDNSILWTTFYHLSAVLMPVVFAAFVDVLARRRADPHPEGRRTGRWALAVSVAVTALLLPDFPLWRLVQPATWQAAPRAAAAHRVMDRIPDGATVATENGLAAQLTDRDAVSVIGVDTLGHHPDWILVDTTEQAPFRMTAAEQAAVISAARAHGYRVAADDDGFLLLKGSGF